jgi:hypothetical protein
LLLLLLLLLLRRLPEGSVAVSSKCKANVAAYIFIGSTCSAQQMSSSSSSNFMSA